MPSKQNVEERVVEMRIDNKNFESGANKTISTLEKLEKALKLKSDTSAIDDLQKAADKFDANPITRSLDKVEAHFSALEVAGLRVIQNLTDSIYNFATKTIKALTIDQVSAGFSKYEKMIESTQTIMAATHDMVGYSGDYDLKVDGVLYKLNLIEDEYGNLVAAADEFGNLQKEIVGFTDEASQMGYVNKQLEELLWFADETSYSFSDMVDNAGKFLANGVPLEETFTAMMGIASWGATAGAKPAEVSRAMYNISQAMGADKMQVVDWRSIENANMATLDFKRNALAVAAELGKFQYYASEETGLSGLIANGAVEMNEFGQIVNMTDEQVEELFVTAEKMRESLKTGWFDRDVMTEVFRRYGEFSDRLYEATQASDLEATEWLQILDKVRKQGDSFNWEKYANDAGLGGMTSEENVRILKEIVQGLEDVGLAYDYAEQGFRRGQEAKTFTDAIEATKDAVSSRWMKTFENIFGDYLEAKEFWTQVTTELYDLFAASGDVRNDILEVWNEVDEFGRNGRTYLLGIEYDEDGEIAFRGALWNIVDAVKSVIEPIRNAFSEVFGLDDIEARGERLRELTKRFQELTEKLILSEEAQQKLHDTFEKVFTVVKSGLDIVGSLVKVLTSVWKTFSAVTTALIRFGKGEITARAFWATIYNAASNMSGALLDFKDNFKSVFNGIKKFLPAGGNLLEFFRNLKTGISRVREELKQWFAVHSFAETLDMFGIRFNFITDALDRLVRKFRESHPKIAAWFDDFKNNSIFANILGAGALAFEKIGETLSNLHFDTTGIREFFDILSSIVGFFTGALIGDPKELTEKIRTFVSTSLTVLKEELGKLAPQSFGDLLMAIKTAFSVVALSELGSIFRAVRRFMYDFDDLGVMASQVLQSLRNTFEGMAKNFRASAYLKMAGAIAIIAGAIYLLSTLDDERMDKATHAAVMLAGIMYILSKATAGGIRKQTVNVSLFSKVGSALIGFAAVLAALMGLFLVVRKINPQDFLDYMLVIMLFVAELLLVTTQLSKLNFVNSKGAIGAIFAISLTLDLLIPVLAAMALMPLDRYLQAVFGVAGLMTAFGILLALMSRWTTKGTEQNAALFGSNMLKMAASIAIMAAALDLLIPILGTLAVMDANTFGKAFAALLGIMALMAGMTWVMGALSKAFNAKGILMIAAAIALLALSAQMLLPVMLSISAAMLGMIPAISAMDDFGTVIKRLGKLVGVMLGLGAGALLIGVGLLAAGIGVVFIAGALSLLASALVPLTVALPAFLEALQNVNAQKIGKGVVIFLALAAAIGVILALLVKLGKNNGAGKALGNFALSITSALLTLAKKLGMTLEQLMPYFIEALSVLLILMGAYVMDKIPEVVDWAVKAIISFFTSLADSMEAHRGELVDSITKIVRTIVGVIGDVFTKLFSGEEWENSSLLEKILLGVGAGSIGIKLLSNFIDPLKSISSLLHGGGKEGGEGLIKSVGKFFGVWKDGVTWIGAGSFGAGISVLMGLAAAMAYSIKMVSDQADILYNRSFEGLDHSVDGYVAALDRATKATVQAKQDLENASLYDTGEGLFQWQQAYDAENANMVKILGELAVMLGVSREELERQMEATGGNVRETKAWKDYTEEETRALRELNDLQVENTDTTGKQNKQLSEMGETLKQIPGKIREAKGETAEAAGEVGKAAADSLTGRFASALHDTNNTNTIKNSAKSPMQAFYNSANDVIGDNSDILGGNVIKELYNSITGSSLTDILDTAGKGLTTEVAVGADRNIGKDISTVGKNSVVGFVNKIYDNLTLSYDAGANLGKAFLSGATSKAALYENSPSKAMAKIAAYAVRGFVDEADSDSGLMNDAGQSVGSAFLSAIQYAMTQVGLLADESFAFSPLITPVVDMSNISAAAGSVNGLLGSSYGLTAGIGNSINRRMNAVERLVSSVGDNTANRVEGDTITFNIYASEGMDEEAIADAVMNRMQTRFTRRKAAFG